MKWIKTKEKIDKTDWHLWFAWKPVTVNKFEDGNEEKVWMTTILRRMVYDTSGVKIGVGGFWRAEYKEKPVQPCVPDKPTKTPLPATFIEKYDTEGNDTYGDIKITDDDFFSLTSDFMGHGTEDCPHENGTIEKMGGRVCRDCSKIVDDIEWLDDDVIKDIDNSYDYTTPEPPEGPQIAKVIIKKVKKPDKVVGESTKHEIDASWEAKRARRSKTIM